jgi:dTDP-4-amino-4,6-dideoxygalactose transaminase
VSRVYLSPPDIGPAERVAVLRALDSGWVAPAGPELDAFEHELAEFTGRTHAVALSSGTAALHLALLGLDVGRGDEVLVPTLTFVASANAVRYVGAQPVFLDSEDRSWNIDPTLVVEVLDASARGSRLPAAVVTVDLYGRCADYSEIVAACEFHGVPIVEDAAEALGASCGSAPAGSFGAAATLSFNGNKIITTSGGGALVTDDARLAERARHLATQAREPVIHYEHVDLGFNYRMSNLLAALGRAQLAGLPTRIEARAKVMGLYREALGGVAGLSFAPEPEWGRSNAWLTCVTIDPAVACGTRDDVLATLGDADIEARHTWKPMHRQPLYEHARARLTGVADRVFDHGLCLPSGSSLSVADQDRVIEAVLGVLGPA